ncbi:MAG: ankyrin repeat domain-containing protein [Chloroflexi bacterium]|nr:ankyrin repeat domain-containing protein [Chloroflexota bacterium]
MRDLLRRHRPLSPPASSSLDPNARRESLFPAADASPAPVQPATPEPAPPTRAAPSGPFSFDFGKISILPPGSVVAPSPGRTHVWVRPSDPRRDLTPSPYPPGTYVQRARLQPPFTPVVIQRVKYAEFLKRYPGYKDLLHRWLRARIPGPDKEVMDERIALLSWFATDEELIDALSTFESRIDFDDLFDPFWSAEDEHEVEAGIMKSKAVGQLIGDVAQGRKIEGNVRILGEAEFFKAYQEHLLRINAELDERIVKILIAAGIDRTLGFAEKGVIYLRKTFFIDKHTVVHESIHLYSSPDFEATFGHLLNEGATETIARDVCSELGIPRKVLAYTWEVSLVRLLLDSAGLTLGDLKDAYFSGNVEKVAATITKVLGAEVLQQVIRGKNAPEAFELCRTTLHLQRPSPDLVYMHNFPLHWAIRQGDQHAFKRLLKITSKVDEQDVHKRTPLHIACYHGCTAMTIDLLNAGADPSIQDSIRCTPLHLACYRQQLGCIKVLAPLKIGLDIADSERKTPLMIVGELKLYPAVEELGKLHKQIKQNRLSLFTDVRVRERPDDTSGSLELSILSTAYLIDQDQEWYRVLYTNLKSFALVMYIKRTDPVYEA